MNAGAASATVVYSNDFQSAVGSEWTTTFGGGLSLDHTAADGNRLFLGRSDGETNGNVDTDPAHLGNGNDVLRLAVNALPTHTKIQLAFDVYAIHSWDGNGPLGNFDFGPRPIWRDHRTCEGEYTPFVYHDVSECEWRRSR